MFHLQSVLGLFSVVIVSTCFDSQCLNPENRTEEKLEDNKELSGAVNRRTDNIMTKRKMTKRHVMMDKNDKKACNDG